MLHHKCHEFSGVSPYVEELEAILFDKRFESRMRCDTDAVTICLFQLLTKSNEGLNVATRSNDLNDDVEPRRGFLAGLTSETRQRIRRR